MEKCSDDAPESLFDDNMRIHSDCECKGEATSFQPSTRFACREESDLLVRRVIAATATVAIASLARFGDAPARPVWLGASPARLVRLGASPVRRGPVGKGRHTTGSEM